VTGLGIKFSGAFTDASLPILRNDPILVNGSLILLDAVNWASGVPDNGAILRNIAAIEAGDIGLTGELGGAVVYTGTLNDGTKGKVERTLKGAIHAIVSQSVDMTGNHGVDIELPTSIMQHMVSNPTHNFYFSQWRRLTRSSLSTSPEAAKAFAYIGRNTSTGYLMLTQNGTTILPATTNQLGRHSAIGENVQGNNFVNVAGKSNDGTTPTIAQYSLPGTRSLAQFGVLALQNNYAPIRKALQSWAIYRMYVEDLTISGRTHAQVDAIDYGLYQEAFGAGGRFAGDTFTSPSTIP
jgi:hypothetical protein